MATAVKLIKTELHDPQSGFSEYDVLLDGKRIGSVNKGGRYSMTYYPWSAGRQSWATRADAVAFVVRRAQDRISAR